MFTIYCSPNAIFNLIRRKYSYEQGCRNPGGWRDISPPIIWLHLPIIWLWSTSASPPMIGLYSAFERWMVFGPFFGFHVISGTNTLQFLVKTLFFWSSLKFGDKNCSIFGEDLFFVLFWSSLNLVTWKQSWSRFIPPQCWKQGKIGVKLQIIPPMLNINRPHWLRNIA